VGEQPSHLLVISRSPAFGGTTRNLLRKFAKVGVEVIHRRCLSQRDPSDGSDGEDVLSLVLTQEKERKRKSRLEEKWLEISSLR
jgi:hypothetical protein